MLGAWQAFIEADLHSTINKEIMKSQFTAVKFGMEFSPCGKKAIANVPGPGPG